MLATAATSENLSARDILAIPASRPEKLFSGDEEADKKLYRRLSLLLHPDRFPDREEAFKRLAELKSQRDKQMETGTWAGAGIQEVRLADGRKLRIRFLRRLSFELGTLLLSPGSVTYLFREEHRALFQQGVRRVKNFPYADARMRSEMSRFLPELELEAEAAEGPVLVIKKTPDVVRLRDVLDHMGGALDPRHVSWILSTLHNMGAYLHWARLTHNAVDLDNYFISPPHHSGLLLGGWWYAREVGEAMTHLPGSSVNVWRTVLPPHVTAEKKATPKLDRELIRQVARCLLGDPGGTRLLRDASLPEALRRWVTTPGSDDGIQDYQNWAKVREAAFGPRRFVKMELPPQALYGGM